MAARNLEKAREEADRLNKDGFCIKCVYNDAAKPESFLSMVEDVVEDAGRIDTLVNNFGTSDPRVDLDFMNTVEMNLRSVYLASQAAAKHMAKAGGSTVNISSVGGVISDISQVAYGTSKAAINYLTRLIAVQGAKYNIRCNAVFPGMTATEAGAQKLSEEFKQMFVRHIPLNRMGLPEKIAGAVVYFAGAESAYTTGQILSISGGFGQVTPVYAELGQAAGKR